LATGLGADRELCGQYAERSRLGRDEGDERAEARSQPFVTSVFREVLLGAMILISGDAD